jgi:hypothetical protein
MSDETPKRVLLPISFFGKKEEIKPKIDTIYLKRGEKEKPVAKTTGTTGGKKKKEPEPNEALDGLLTKEKPTKKDVIEYFKGLA